jgi:3-oxoacyl-[acyl-carrier-protein] synthase III
VPASTVLGCGRHLPPRIVTSEELGTRLGTSASALIERSGIRVRHYVEAGLGPSDLGREAALGALAAAGLEPADVDLIVFATMTPDIPFPGPGCFLQHKLGCRTVGALDVRAQCAGFLFALATADRFVRAEAARCVLVVGGEVHSTALDFSPRGAAVTPTFGDGAGAVIIGAAAAPGVLATVLHSDPTDLERFWCEFPSSRHYPARMDLEQFAAGTHFYRLDATRVHPQAESALVSVAEDALARADVPASRVALWIMHYLDPRVARRAADRLGAPADRVVATAEAAGHIAAGGLPIALADALASGRVSRGDVVCSAAFGAGMSWGSAIIRL